MRWNKINVLLNIIKEDVLYTDKTQLIREMIEAFQKTRELELIKNKKLIERVLSWGYMIISTILWILGLIGGG